MEASCFAVGVGLTAVFLSASFSTGKGHAVGPGVDASDPHWEEANKDEHLNIQRGMETTLDSGRVVRADVLRFYPSPSEKSKCDKVFFFIPGNPGLVDFYLVFLRQIFLKLGQDWYVVAIGHAGHSSQSHGGELREVSYPEQIEHKVKFLLQEFPHLDNTSQVVIAGHSVGARIGLELMHQLHGQLRFEQYIGLCPTVLHIAESPNGQKLGKFLANAFFRWACFVAVHLLAALLWLIPVTWRLSVVKNAMKTDCPEVDWYYTQHGLKLVDPFLVRNVLLMAHGEMEMILGHEDEAIQHAVEHSQDRIAFVLSPVDKWCCSNIVERMQAVFVKSGFVMLHDKVRHAFCLSHQSVLDVVDAIFQQILNSEKQTRQNIQ